MTAPALIARNLMRLLTTRVRLPEHLEIHIHVAQISDWLAQFAGAYAAIEINNDGCFTCGAAHRPFGRAFGVFELCTMAKNQCSDICGLFHPLPQRVSIKQTVR